MKVLVDTSVWSLALRKGGPADHDAVRVLASLLENGEDVVLTGLILQEILQGFRTDATADRVEKYLRPFELLPLAREGFAAAARLHRRCAAKGISASTADCQIAVAAMQHDCLLLTTDKDFQRIAALSTLRVAGC